MKSALNSKKQFLSKFRQVIFMIGRETLDIHIKDNKKHRLCTFIVTKYSIKSYDERRATGTKTNVYIKHMSTSGDYTET